ncbi:hypothetical protein FBEOM_9217 [Fusarium beomiforme]|uniref:Hint domain-containing protein n=1 Tax=Fusarium beomiforme TaxID=44412 RepID=A0A9P5AE06_9HYPO|nr:hypothetical protein FBEOM_9217 [Fusarium beomiforme]
MADQGFSGFVAGTMIETRNDTKAIEQLSEGDWVLTRADGEPQYGLRSDEIVESPAPPVLYGFNHERAFFTPAQPFYTTTGIRAIDPNAAMRANPWLEVGRLMPGHVLIRWDASQMSYEHVAIASLHADQSDGGNVYGLHLREGLRSFHANSYLVSLNYPEITAGSLGKQLRGMPPDARAEMLERFKGLKPVFERFGAQGFVDRLEAESNPRPTRPGRIDDLGDDEE